MSDGLLDGYRSDDGLNWSCGHPLTQHDREGAISCLRKHGVARRVPRIEEGGASAPPDARPQDAMPPQRSFDSYADTVAETYESYIASYHGAMIPLTREQWSEGRQRPNRCARHGVMYTKEGVCGLCADESVFIESTAPLSAADFCAEAARLVGGPRAATHGADRALNFTLIADLWNGYWRMKCRVNDEQIVTPFTALDIGNMMELMKISRRMLGSFNADDYTDAAGYAGCTGEIAAKEAATHES